MKKILSLLFLALCFMGSNAQRQLIKGKVTDETGRPLAGATVTVRNTNLATVTDTLGNFEIQPGTQASPSLLVTYVGFTQMEVTVRGNSDVMVRLRQDAGSLNDVVVVGYGVQRKRDVTGATSTVKAEEIAKRPLTRVEQALQGTTSGVVVTSNNGQPGVGMSVRIRGVNSITGSNDPLYVIDGYIGGNIESINPSDIESLEILKDASSTAIYGSRGSNGVVLITTKTGKEGKARIDLGAWFSKASIPKELDLMNGYDFARTVNLQNSLLGSGPAFNDEQLAALKASGGTNWQKELHRKPTIQNYQLTVSGGNAGVKYLFSFNQLDQPGLILNQWYKRSTLRANVDVKVNSKLDLKFNIVTLIPRSRNNQYQGDLNDPFSQAYQWDPTSPVRDPVTGKYIRSAQYASIQFNPVAQANNQLVDNSNTNITGTGVLTYRILKGLTFTSNNTYELQWGLGQSLFGLETGNGAANSDFAQVATTKYRAFQNSNFLTYSNSFGDHSITLTALYEQQTKQNITANSLARNLSTYALGYYNLSLGATQQTSSGYWADALQSYMGRVNYSYKDKYLLTASLRSDGSSHLTKKYSTFPSIGLGWNLSKETLIDSWNIFSDLKIRATYGQTGNQAVPPYATIAQIMTGGQQPAYFFDGTTASVVTPLGAPVSKSLEWENTETYDAGLDAAFLNGRLLFSADVYKKKITSLLYSYQAPFYLGGGNYSTNIGSIENKGVDLSLGGTPVSNNVIKWSTNLTLSFNRNKVLDLGGLDNIVVGGIGSATNNASILKVGRPLGQFYGYDYLGTWKSAEADEAALFGMKPGDAKYRDVNDDHAYTAADLSLIGNGTPKYSWGFINDVSYGNFTLSVMFQGTQGNQIFSQTLAYTWGGLGDVRHATTQDALSIWTSSKETDNPSFSNTSKNFNNSSRYVYNASYVKLKNLLISYNIPTQVLSRVKMRSLEVYVSGQNIYTSTKFPGYDPEVTNATNAITQGLEMGVIPNPKTFTVGLRAGF